MPSEEEFLYSTVGLLAHHMKELSLTVGAINVLMTSLDDPIISQEAKSLSPGLEDLHASISRVADAFPPPPQNGGRRTH
jgi:hypothetical protein